eukprot:gnl/Chilomastix_cuspidata/210.p3 GENE.gnl/Chilomastix_cuspidata/210~~gnl/Chilomastix_cuspidata/210.p3  ORF type:complete len:197 (+),score=108.52 gnl/Chilomastix_cuspidata/210:1-591(+)
MIPFPSFIRIRGSAMSTNAFKVAIIGSGSVGKSCLVIRFTSDKFFVKYNPTIQDRYSKDIAVDGKAVRLDILDTAGQDEFTQLRDTYMKEGKGIILVYSIVSLTSFDECDDIHEQVLRIKECPPDKILMTLVGNKCDLEDERQVTAEQGQEKAAAWGCDFLETSALDGTNVAKLFEDIARRMIAAEPKKKRRCAIL